MAFARPIDSLAIVEIETRAGEAAGRRLGQMLVELETVSDAQHAVPIYRAAASLALWQGDHADAGRAAARGWDLVAGSGRLEPHRQDGGDRGRGRFDGRRRRRRAPRPGDPGDDPRPIAERRPGRRPRRSTASGVGPTIGSRREADAWLALATAHRDRLEGHDDPAAWDRLADAWHELANPYEVAKARWREAEAILGQR